MARFYDFDAARAARRAAPPPTALIFGETVELPRSMPAAVYLMRERNSAANEVTATMLIDELRLLVGDRVDGWVLEHDLEEDDLLELLHNLVRLVNTPEPGGGAEGEAPAPAAGASPPDPSSSSGSSSSPTSPASTGSI